MSFMSSAICVFLGTLGYLCVYHLAASLLRRDYRRHLALSVICLLTFVLMLAQLATLYLTSLAAHVMANKIAIACILLSFCLLFIFTAKRLRLASFWVLLGVAPGAFLLLVNLVKPYGVQFAREPYLASQQLPWGESLLWLQGEPSLWMWVGSTWGLGVLVAAAVIALVRWRQLRDPSDIIIALSIALCWLANLYGIGVRLGLEGVPYSGIMAMAMLVLVISMVFIQEDARERQKGVERLSAIFNGAPDGIMVVGNDGIIKAANPGLRRLFEAGSEELEGRLLEELVPAAHRAQHHHYRDGYQQKPRVRPMSGNNALPALSRTGREFPTDVSLAPIDWNGERATVAFVRDATERVAQARHLEWLANHDEKTNLPNRGGLLRFLQRHQPEGNYWIAMIGIDNLGRVNEAFGHDKGDAIIQATAARLRDFREQGEYCARFEGDHFVFVADDVERIYRLHQLLQAPVRQHGLVLQVSVCMGYLQTKVAALPAQALQYAQSALVQAKFVGHGAMQLFDAENLGRDRRRLDLASRMRTALGEQEFMLVYQPRVALGGGCGSSFEALVRWQNGDTPISPAEFIPIAEQSGFIISLGDWILVQALVQIRRWLDAGYPLRRVAVNVSMRQLADPGFVERVLQLLHKYAVPPAHLELEVTETAAMESLDFVVESLQQLAEAGITLAMDDFGTGYSSLAYLQKLPFRVIKIDMSFVRRLGTAEGDELMQGMLALLRSLKRDIVAEGIETPAQLAWLQQAGCDEGQGYCLSKPLNARDATAWLEMHH